jgi:hypothetical protein
MQFATTLKTGMRDTTYCVSRFLICMQIKSPGERGKHEKYSDKDHIFFGPLFCGSCEHACSGYRIVV